MNSRPNLTDYLKQHKFLLWKHLTGWKVIKFKIYWVIETGYMKKLSKSNTSSLINFNSFNDSLLYPLNSQLINTYSPFVLFSIAPLRKVNSIFFASFLVNFKIDLWSVLSLMMIFLNCYLSDTFGSFELFILIVCLLM
jgi:hypothetical protein